MDIRSIKYFMTIAEEKQFSKAAKKLHMTQPPLSQQIKQLENELEAVLFDRNGRQIELTEAGKVLYTKGKEILDSVDTAIEEVKTAEKGIIGTIRIGSLISTSYMYANQMVEFSKTHESIDYSITLNHPSIICNKIIDRELDLAFIRLPINTGDLAQKIIKTEPFVLICSKKSPLSKKPAVSLNDIVDLPIILLEKGHVSAYYELVVDEFTKEGLKPNIIAVCPNSSIILDLVVNGLGITILPYMESLHLNKDHIEILEIPSMVIKSEIAIVWRKDDKRIKIQKFLEMFD